MVTPQYTYDNAGRKVGVFFAIEDWNELKRVPGVEELSQNDSSLAEWQIEKGKKELQNVAEGNTELLDWNASKKQFKL
jgi:hypothetical protein